MKKILFLLLLTLLQPLQAAVERLDGIAAVVDEDVITELELQQRFDMMLTQLRQRSRNLPPLPILRRQILERMIVEKIQLSLAKQLGIRVDDEQLNKVLSNIAAENGLNLMQFSQALAREGIDYTQFREQIRNEIAIGQLRSKQVDNRVNVTPQEVERFLDSRLAQQNQNTEYRLSHLLIAVPESADAEQIEQARAEAEDLHQQLLDGADFTQLAIAYSDGQQALEGGDLGWRRAAELPTIFTDTVLKMEPGEVSEPIRSPSGYHLLQLQETRGEERHYTRQVNARHILIKSDAITSDTEAQQKIRRLRQRILSGEDFATLARGNSDDTGSAAQGGELGWSDPAIYVPAFRETLSKLQIGELSEPFKSEFGWHIVELLGWRDHDDTEEQRRNQAFQALRQRRIEEAQESWLRRLRDEAYVEYRLDQ